MRLLREQEATGSNPVIPTKQVFSNTCRGVAQSGSASALGAEGRGFESLRPDQISDIEHLVAINFHATVIGGHRSVAQPGSAHAWGAWGREFESHRSDQSIGAD